MIDWSAFLPLPEGFLFRFAEPWALWLLLLVPLLALLKGKRGGAGSLRFPAVALARQVSAFVRSRPGRFLPHLRWVVLVFLILALARPQAGEETRERELAGIDIVLLIDLSTSMWAHDFQRNETNVDRLTVVKEVVEEFIERRPSDRIGMVAFAGKPYLVSPLTFNHDWLQQNLARLRLGMVEDGTAIGLAIGVGSNRLRHEVSRSKVIILLTDGDNNRGQIGPVPASEAAAAFGIRIHTIAMGREGLIPFPINLDREGQPVRDRLGRVRLRQVESQVDFSTLEEVAEISGGKAFRAINTEQLEAIYDEIDSLEKTEVKVRFRALYRDLFLWPLGLGLVLLGIEQLLLHTRYRRLP